MTESAERPKISPERAARNNRIVMVICTVFFAVLAVAFGAYAYHQHEDYAVRTTPPGGRTTEVVVDDVETGRHCQSSGTSSHCSPEYTLEYVVDGERHTTPIRKHLRSGTRVHAFKGSDGKWYVTEDPGFGNSRVAWMFYAGGGAMALIAAILCVSSWRKIPKPT